MIAGRPGLHHSPFTEYVQQPASVTCDSQPPYAVTIWMPLPLVGVLTTAPYPHPLAGHMA